MTREEKLLVEALHRGDRYACNDLVETYSGKIYNVALRLTNNPVEAEDVLQETFINACKAAGDFEGRSSLGTWLYRIATNNGLMHIRRRQAPTVPLDAPTNNEALNFKPQLLQSWDWNPETEALSDELRQVMDKAVESLPDTLQAAFVLRDLEGLSTQEAADTLGISTSNLKVRLHRARFMLREQLAAYFNEHGEEMVGAR